MLLLRHLELTVTAIKTGAVRISQGHWKLYPWLQTYDLPL